VSAARSWVYLLLCNLMWSLQFTCVKLVQDQVGAFATVWGPMTLATVMLYPLVRREQTIRPRKGERSRRDILLFLTLAALGVFPGQFFITWGTRLSLASNAALLMLTLPIATAILARVFLAEKMTGIRWVSFALALAGVLLCSDINLRTLDFSGTYLAGNSLIFAGLLGCAYYNSYGKKVLRRYSPLEMLLYTYAAMFVIMTPLTLWREPNFFAATASFTLPTWTGLILLTFFHNYLSMALFLKALDYLDAIQAALSNYLITFFGLPISAIWLGERLTPVTAAGGVLVLLSTLLITIWEERQRRAAAICAPGAPTSKTPGRSYRAGP
jgi:drug/metabolite transporter (DMT)-like permease